MKSILKILFFSMAIIGGLSSCNNSNQMKESRLRDSLYQDSLRKDSLQREMKQSDSLLMDDSLSINNREMRTP